jgi:hypothetical protein
MLTHVSVLAWDRKNKFLETEVLQELKERRESYRTEVETFLRYGM